MSRHTLPILSLLGLACVSAPTPQPAWHPIEGARSSTWGQVQEICGPLLPKGQAAVLAGDGTVSDAVARAPYDSCMAHQGWKPRADADEPASRVMRDEVNRFLDQEIQPRRTKAEFSHSFGAPRCHPAGPGAEICVWELDYRSEVAEQSYPTVLTCVLPEDGSPRRDASCQLDAK